MDQIAEIRLTMREDGYAESFINGDDGLILWGMATLVLAYSHVSEQSLDKALLELRNEARRIQIENLADQIQETQGTVIDFEELIKGLES